MSGDPIFGTEPKRLKRLAALGKAAQPALEKAVKESKSPEVRWRHPVQGVTPQATVLAYAVPTDEAATGVAAAGREQQKHKFLYWEDFLVANIELYYLLAFHQIFFVQFQLLIFRRFLKLTLSIYH